MNLQKKSQNNHNFYRKYHFYKTEQQNRNKI